MHFVEFFNPNHMYFGQDAELQDLKVSCHITGAVVTEADKQLRSNRAPGWKKHCEFLRSLDVSGLSWLTRLCSSVWTSGTVPLEWQTGMVVVALFKKGDWRVCSNYWGITLLSLPGNVDARVLEGRICLFVEHRTEENPCGLCPDHGTLDQFILTRVLKSRGI